MSERTRSTASARRVEVLDAAARAFASTGYHATTLADVAEEAGISPGYVARLFGSKLSLFVALLDRTYRRIAEDLESAADGAGSTRPEQVLDVMAASYARLIADRDLLMLQVHAQSATGIAEVRDAVRRGLERIVETASRRSHADIDAVQRFLAFGQLCHLVVTAEIDRLDSDWARTVAHGIRHPD